MDLLNDLFCLSFDGLFPAEFGFMEGFHRNIMEEGLIHFFLAAILTNLQYCAK